MAQKKIIFITGTDTGVGKTLLTALLLHRLGEDGVHALAMKPFCSGGLADVRLLQSLQSGELSDREMNPFYFKQPVAPLVAAQKRRPIRLEEVVRKIRSVEEKCDRLLIEGSGGLLVPLGPGFMVADLIAKLDCCVIIVARNRLGTINHTLLTVQVLQQTGLAKKNLRVVLMSQRRADVSSRSNRDVLAKILHPVPVIPLPFFGIRASTIEKVKRNSTRAKSVLVHFA